jgi:hypothetical protein
VTHQPSVNALGLCESCGRHKAVHRCGECGKLLCDERTCSISEVHEYSGEAQASVYCHACAAKPGNRLNEEELDE